MSPHEIPLLDLQRTHGPLRPELEAAIDRVLSSGQFINGDEVVALEQELAAALGLRHCILASSGTDALLATLMVRDLGPGDEVVCPTFSFFATAGCIWRTGAQPVFADIRADSFLVDVETLRRHLSPETKALVAVHLFGECCDMEPIRALADEHGLYLIEDAAQAIAASDAGRPAGALGDIAAFSFFPTKNLGGFGDGGFVSTEDDDLAERVRSVRNHGQWDRYLHDRVGGNFRLDALQAAMLRVKLPRLAAYNDARRHNADFYDRALAAAGLCTGEAAQLALPPRSAGGVVHQYVLRVLGGRDRRDALRTWLGERGVASAVYYPLPLHLQPCFASLGWQRGDLPNAERAADQVLAIPIFPELRDEELERVVDEIGAFFAADPGDVA